MENVKFAFRERNLSDGGKNMIIIRMGMIQYTEKVTAKELGRNILFSNSCTKIR